MLIDRDAVAAFDRDGYLLAEDVLTPAEVAVLRAATDSGRAAEVWDAADGAGASSPMSLWSTLGDDVWSAASTCPRIVNPLRMLLGEDIAFFHGKIIFKNAGTAGVVEWHQDYGYWYGQFLQPRLISAWVALDPATRENGCLEVLRGSHRLGRLEHRPFNAQSGADPERLALVRPHFEHVHCEMRPGSVLFFDCNLLHGSGPNLSARDRRAFIVCYNACGNPALRPGQAIDQSPCPVAADDAIMRRAGSAQPVGSP
ncbi:MAG TPA: phytanoyl-CoA dioxygenase family protein [Planctomycetota bacterium]|nr:phytanoyl-CoA dioxygenase family protein [Planctomycetota bacterium]